MRKVFFFIAVGAWLCSFIIHLLSVFNIDVAFYFPWVWGFHLLVIITWFPVGIELWGRHKDRWPENEGFGEYTGFYKDLFRNTPVWLIVLAVLCIVYVIFSLIFFHEQGSGSAECNLGQYVLVDDKKNITVITAEEYHLRKASLMRGFSSFWMLFSGLAIVVLYPFKKTG